MHREQGLGQTRLENRRVRLHVHSDQLVTAGIVQPLSLFFSHGLHFSLPRKLPPFLPRRGTLDIYLRSSGLVRCICHPTSIRRNPGIFHSIRPPWFSGPIQRQSPCDWAIPVQQKPSVGRPLVNEVVFPRVQQQFWLRRARGLFL